MAIDSGNAGNDAALMARVVAGDQAAMVALYDRFSGLVFAICVRMLPDRAAAEELLSDVFVEAWKRGANFDAVRGGLATWLATITRSRGIDRIRSRQRQAQTGSEAVLAQAPSTVADPSQSTMSADERARVARVLSALGPQQREAIELGYFQGLTQSEIAERLGRPLGTVKSHMRQALIQLREALRTNGEEGA